MARRAGHWLGGALVTGALSCTPTPEEVMDPTVGDTADDAEIPVNCGNGVIDPGEECDDADADDPLDGCLIDCRYGPTGFITGMPFITAQHGSLGADGQVTNSCPPGELLVALRGLVRTNSWLSRLQGSCGRPQLVPSDDGYRVEVADGDELAVHGGDSEGTDEVIRCPPHQVVVGFGGYAGDFVDQITLRCAPLYVFEGDVGWEVSLGEVSDTAPLGNPGGNEIPATSCGETMNFVSTGLHLRVGDDILAFALQCAPLVLQTGP